MVFSHISGLTNKVSNSALSSNEHDAGAGESVALDQESLIGSSPLDLDKRRQARKHEQVDDHIKNLDECDTTGDKTLKILLRGDRVFVLSSRTAWDYFINGLHCEIKYVVGSVVLNKEWKDGKYYLGIRWENGKLEALPKKCEQMTFGERMFVLDRECVTPGSKVFFVGQPEKLGTVLRKSYLATGNCTQNPNLIFEDVDVSLLRRDNHGSSWKGIKILLRGWIGLTSGYRTRVHLKTLSEGNCNSFYIIVDENHSQTMNVGDEITLGFKLLRAAEVYSEENEFQSNWFLNFFRLYNTRVAITAIEMEELTVYWIGKKAAPKFQPNPFDLPGAPSTVIPYEDLQEVEYLIGDNCSHVTSKSLWKFDPSSSSPVRQFASGEEDDAMNPTSKHAWTTKWLKIMDWDRWEYPSADHTIPNDFQKSMEKELTLEIMYCRSVVDVLWKDGTTTACSCGDLIPIQTGSVWSSMQQFYHNGVIVSDRFDKATTKKYGVITNIGEEQGATVKWITPNENAKGGANTISATVSLYDLAKKSEYEYISKTDQCPLVNCDGVRNKIGVALGICCETGKVSVRFTNGTVDSYWPHELTHYKCDVWMCPNENRWSSWYDHFVPPSGFSHVTPELCTQEICTHEDNFSITLSGLPKNKLESFDEVPLDNIFVNEDFLPRFRETHYRRAVENEISEMEKCLPKGIWVEYYTSRGDIMSTVVLGPDDTLFEDFLFIFDIFLMEDFPTSEPHLNLRSFGVTVYPGHFCNNGGVYLPQETRLEEKDFSYSYILNLLLEVQDFMALPLEVVHGMDKSVIFGNRPEDPVELYKFILLAILEYTLALLRNPPKNWSSLINQHYIEALPRVIKRIKEGRCQTWKRLVIVSNESEKGDFVNVDKYEFVTVPWSEAYKKSVYSRIFELEQIHAAMKNA